MNILDVAKHLIQVALTEQFRLPVSVNFTLKEGLMDVTMMRQSTLSEFMFEEMEAPLWTDVIVNLSPRILSDPDTLTSIYRSVYAEVATAISRGRVWNAIDV
jgi:hypothetical protein|tara:strand:- start:125 stop:430 length:306 start_codon:yes stop_codon:yes gene_type:complete